MKKLRYSFSCLLLVAMFPSLTQAANVIVNGETYTVKGDNIHVSNVSNGVIINGEEMEVSQPVNIEVYGDVKTLSISSCGNCEFKGDVSSIDSVSGEIDAGNIQGDVSTVSGNVIADTIEGGVSTISGSIKR